MTQPQHEIIRGLHNLRPEHKGAVVTIGSFDGVHLGHQAILKQVIDKARELQQHSMVIVFEPQPAEYFSGGDAPARLMRFREKAETLFAAGIDRVLCLYFNDSLRSLSASDFVNRVIIQGLLPAYLVVGDDFHFGRDRGGEVELLQRAGQTHGFEVVDTQTHQLHGERVSSTRIRETLADSNFEFAARLLGKPFSMTGRVLYGRQLGRTLGIPTANLLLHRYCSPLNGVYAVEVRLHDGAWYNGVANIGVRPTVGGDLRPVLETHILDFNGFLYGKSIEVRFRKKIRDEQSFESVELLKAQIVRDITVARQYFETRE